jgi:hypothetical protein
VTAFIETVTDEYVPVARIAVIGDKTDRDGDLHFETSFHRVQTIDGERYKIASHTMARHVVTTIPVPAGSWECLVPVYIIDEIVDRIQAYPVMAWAINLLGEIRPIVPDTMAVEPGKFGLRKAVRKPAPCRTTNRGRGSAGKLSRVGTDFELDALPCRHAADYGSSGSVARARLRKEVRLRRSEPIPEENCDKQGVYETA